MKINVATGRSRFTWNNGQQKTNLILFLAQRLSSFWVDSHQFGIVLAKFGAGDQSVSAFQCFQNSVIDK